MKKTLTQGSEEWLEWRRTKIGASDAPIIMGENPYMKPEVLKMKKILGIEEEMNFFMKRGKELESEALYYFTLIVEMPMSPICFESDEFSWMTASLDGWNEDNRTLVEIKCPGKKTHSIALEGKVPVQYIAQLQHQMKVMEVDECYYYSYYDGQGKVIEVKRDQAYIDRMIEKEYEFWKSL